MTAKRAILDMAFATYRQAAQRVPKKKGLILFGARRGQWYMDNSRQVYEWILEKRPDLEPVWMTRSKQVESALKAKGLPVCHTSSPRAFYLLSRASLAVTSTQLYDITSIPECPPDNLHIVFLGHGKSVKASSLAKRRPRSQWSTSLFKRQSELIDIGISTSPFISELAAKSNGLTIEQFRDTGYPVNDMLVRPPEQNKSRFQEYLGTLRPKATVLYAPTWRPSWIEEVEPTRFFPFEDFDKGDLVRFLEENKILLLLRPHELDILKYGDFKEFLNGLAKETPWIRVCTPNDIDNVNDIMPFIDCLITDYSSIYHDYLLLDRPMIFTPYDYEDFAKHTGFMYDYFYHLPGPAVASQCEFLQSLSGALTGEDTHADKRHALRELIHSHTDGRSTERVVQIINEKLNGQNGSLGRHKEKSIGKNRDLGKDKEITIGQNGGLGNDKEITIGQNGDPGNDKEITIGQNGDRGGHNGDLMKQKNGRNGAHHQRITEQARRRSNP